MASHSAAHALCQASRDLTDLQLDAIAASDGLVGIVYACPFLRPDFADVPDTPLALIARHAAEREAIAWENWRRVLGQWWGETGAAEA